MSSLHSTLTALIDALVRDILRVVRESSVHELVGVAAASSRKRALGAEAPPLSSSHRTAPRTAGVAKRRAPRAKPRDVEPVPAAPKKRRGRSAQARPSTPPVAVSSDVIITEREDTPKDAAQITDPNALLRETAVTVPVPPRPWASEMAVVSPRVEVPSLPTLRDGEALLRTPSGRAVLRRRRNA